MGNLCSSEDSGSNDEENNLAVSLADAASFGAREGVIEAFKKQVAEGGQQNAAIGGLIGGVLSIEKAKKAAAARVKQELDRRVTELNFAARFARDLKQMKTAAASGAKAGLQELEILSQQVDIEENALKVIKLEIAAAAAAIGARVASFVSVQRNLSSNSNNYTALLGPMLGGSFPTSIAVYNLLSNSSDVVKLCGFGGLALAVFVISSGLAAGSLGRTTKSACYTRLATLVAITIVLTLFTAALCTLLSTLVCKIVFGVIGGGFIVLFIYLWLRLGW